MRRRRSPAMNNQSSGSLAPSFVLLPLRPTAMASLPTPPPSTPLHCSFYPSFAPCSSRHTRTCVRSIPPRRLSMHNAFPLSLRICPFSKIPRPSVSVRASFSLIPDPSLPPTRARVQCIVQYMRSLSFLCLSHFLCAECTPALCGRI